jgi:anaerobic ribonucleoside-triphosphate reductase
MAELRLFPNISQKSITTGWKTFKTGVSAANYGGTSNSRLFCQDCGEMMVSRTDIEICTKCGSKNVEQIRMCWIPGFPLGSGHFPIRMA